MTPELDQISNAAACPALEADGSGDNHALNPVNSPGLFARQLAAAGLDEVAAKVASGALLDLADATALSRASLPLVGRIVQLMPYVGWASQSVSDDRTDLEVHPTVLPVMTANPGRSIGQTLTDWETFCRRLLEIREDLKASGETASWYPCVTRPPDEDGISAANFTGVDVLRAIALARLLLPENVQIIAPLATLGPKLAHVALDFGASHLGFVSREGPVSNGPLTIDPAVLNELQGSCEPTAMKVEALKEDL